MVTDTTQYLPAEVIERHGIHLVSLYVNWDGKTDREIDLPDYDGYYDFLKSAGELPTTSQPSLGDFLAVYEPLIEAGDQVLSIHLSGGISGTVRAAEQARELLIERGMPAEQMIVLDSRTGSAGHGFMSVAAANAVERGADLAGAAGRRRQAARGPADPRHGRHARVPAPRRADRRGVGVDRRDAEGQAHPHDRGRDAPRRARAHRRAAPSSDSSRTSSSAARTGATRSPSSTSRRPPTPSASPSAAARSTAATRRWSRSSARSSAPTSVPGVLGVAGLRTELLGPM